jgi:hypothetical protein
MAEPEPEEGEEPLELEQVKETRALYCKYCGEGPFPTMSQLGVHSRKCAKRKEKEAEEKAKKGEPPTPYKTEVDVNSILEEILSRHPDITPKVKEEVMDWARLKGGLQPMEVQSILQSMRGITGSTAGIIANKYAFALTKAQQEGKLQLPAVFASAPVMPTQPQMFLPSFPSYQPQLFQPSYQPMPQPQPQAPQPQTWSSQPYVWQPPYPQFQQPPQQDLRSVIREELRSVDDRLRRLEEPKPKEAEGLVEIEEPIRDPDGKIVIGPDDRPIVKRMKVPASQASLYAPKAEDAELKVLEKMELYKKIFSEKKEEVKPGITRDDVELTVKKVLEDRESKLTPEDVMKIVEEKLGEKAKPEESPELSALRADLGEAKKKLDEMKESMEKKEKESLEKEIKRLEDDIRRVESSRTVEGYHADEYRFMGQGLDKIASVAEKKEPIKIVIEKLPELTSIATGVVPQQPAPPQARVGLLQMLRQQGLTTPR